MSIETWKETFYPNEPNEGDKDIAVEHSLKKWIGFRPDNLKQHGLEARDIINAELDTGDHCALCICFLDKNAEPYDGCNNCPLFQVKDEPCYELWAAQSNAPFNVWRRTHNPEPMIELLIEALPDSKKPQMKLLQLLRKASESCSQ